MRLPCNVILNCTLICILCIYYICCYIAKIKSSSSSSEPANIILKYNSKRSSLQKDDMFTSGNGDRQDARNIAIVITDGNSNVDEERTIPAAIDARLRGIHIVVVAIGTQLNQLELRGIASQPPGATLYNARSWRDLPGQLRALVAATCDGTSSR